MSGAEMANAKHFLGSSGPAINRMAHSGHPLQTRAIAINWRRSRWLVGKVQFGGECIDVPPEILALARPAVENSSRNVRLISHTAESLPLDDKSFDTVVVTWALCSIPDPVVALRQARRVLKPGGQLRFVEHGLAPNAGVARWQDRLTPMWSYCAGGCHLNRKTDDLLGAAGFTIPELSTGYAPGLRPFSYMYEGTAVPT